MSTLISRIFDFKKLGLLKNEESVIGLDIGSSAIKVVQLRRKGGKVALETYGAIALGPYAGSAVGQGTSLSTEKLAEAIKDLCTEANVTTKNASLSIPLRSSLLSVIEIPEFSEKELAQAIPLEARKYIPVPISEVELDWWVLPKQDFAEIPDDAPETLKAPSTKNKIEVLLVAIHKEVLAKYRDVVTQSGLNAGSFEIETFSAIRAVMGRDIVPIVMIDIGASSTKLTVVDYGIVKLSHSIPKGAQDVTVSLATSLGVSFEEAERRKRTQGVVGGSDVNPGTTPIAGGTSAMMSSIMEYIFFESNRVIADYQKRHGRLIQKIILIGGGALLPGTLPLAQKAFEAEVVMGDPFSKAAAPAFLAPVLKEAGPEFAISIGLALRQLQES